MDKREWRAVSERLQSDVEDCDWQACDLGISKLERICELAEPGQAKRLREIVAERKNEVDRAKRRHKERAAREPEDRGIVDEEKKGHGQPDEVKNLLIAMHKADQAIEEAINLRSRIRDQGERLLGVGDRVDKMMEELPAIGSIMKKINRLHLRNQLIIHGVFYVCLYFLITSAL
jgi:hypothetical protein